MSLYGKTTLVNALLMTHILMAARLFFPSQSQIKRLNTIVFKFLWFPSFLEPIKRSKMVKDHKDGGLRFPDIQSKIKAVFMMKLLLTIQNKLRDHFFIAYISYNLNRKLIPYNKTLYQRNSINRLFPNHYWETTFNLLEPILKHQTDWQELNFQSIYWILLDSTPLPLPSINASQNPTSWLTVFYDALRQHSLPHWKKNLLSDSPTMDSSGEVSTNILTKHLAIVDFVAHFQIFQSTYSMTAQSLVNVSLKVNQASLSLPDVLSPSPK